MKQLGPIASTVAGMTTVKRPEKEKADFSNVITLGLDSNVIWVSWRQPMNADFSIVSTDRGIKNIRKPE
jgi:hypothetical protein